MSNNNSNDVLAWVANVRGLAAELSRPIENTSDPRYIALVEKFGTGAVEGVDYAKLGGDYFRHFGSALLPAPPIPAPSWAESHTYYLDDYPHTVGVEFAGKKWDTGTGDPNVDPDVDGPEASARLVHTFHIAVDGFEADEHGPGRESGEVWSEPFGVEIEYLEPKYVDSLSRVMTYVAVDSARALNIALADALHAVPFGTTSTE